MTSRTIYIVLLAGLTGSIGIYYICYALLRDVPEDPPFRWGEFFSSGRSLRTSSRKILLLEGLFALALMAGFLFYHFT